MSKVPVISFRGDETLTMSGTVSAYGREWVARMSYRSATWGGGKLPRKTKKAFLKHWRDERLTTNERARLRQVRDSEARRFVVGV